MEHSPKMVHLALAEALPIEMRKELRQLYLMEGEDTVLRTLYELQYPYPMAMLILDIASNYVDSDGTVTISEEDINEEFILVTLGDRGHAITNEEGVQHIMDTMKDLNPQVVFKGTHSQCVRHSKFKVNLN